MNTVCLKNICPFKYSPPALLDLYLRKYGTYVCLGRTQFEFQSDAFLPWRRNRAQVEEIGLNSLSPTVEVQTESEEMGELGIQVGGGRTVDSKIQMETEEMRKMGIQVGGGETVDSKIQASEEMGEMGIQVGGGETVDLEIQTEAEEMRELGILVGGGETVDAEAQTEESGDTSQKKNKKKRDPDDSDLAVTRSGSKIMREWKDEEYKNKKM